MSKINRSWHATHPMPVGGSDGQRIAWHIAHVAHCGCTPIPPGVLWAMQRCGIAPPASTRGAAARADASSQLSGSGSTS